ncbi:MAG TPA: hypothetical protein VLD37_02385 [Candidatus Bilamarchaeum sp.]|nr:hypothetical protein [Candidatus Bilamarchaeum sp.]
MDPLNLANFALHMSGFKLNQWKSPEEIQKIQANKLARILSLAKNSVPHYRKSLAGIESVTPDQLGRLPVLEKAEIAKNPQSLVNPGARNLQAHPTSGSSGIPLKIVIGDDGIYGLALRYHCLTESGLGPFDTLLHLLSFPLYRSFPQKFVYRFINISPFEDERKILDKMRGAGRGVYFGYPSTLTVLSELNNASGSPIALKKIIPSSETFSDSARKFAEKSFSCKSGNYYGANECWGIAFECDRGSLHVNSDSVIVEIVDEDGEPAGLGKSGSVLITSLWRTSMPFIRYRIGDIASFEAKCPCGRGTPVLSRIEGRSTSFIILPGGQKFLWPKIGLRLRHLEGILQFQGVQESPERLAIRLVPSGRPSAAVAEAVHGIVASALPGMIVKVGWVEKIGREKSGKVRDFIPLEGASR